MAIRLDLNKINEEKEEYIKYLHDFHQAPLVGEKFRYITYYENDPAVQKARSEVATFRKQEREALLAIKQPPQKPPKKKKVKTVRPVRRLSFFDRTAEYIAPPMDNLRGEGKENRLVGRVNNIRKKIVSIQSIEDLNAVYEQLEELDMLELKSARLLCDEIQDVELASRLKSLIGNLIKDLSDSISFNTLVSKVIIHAPTPENEVQKAVLIPTPMGGKPKR